MNKKPNKNKPFFSFNFLTEYTHNYMAVTTRFDERMEIMLMNLNKTGALNNTLSNKNYFIKHVEYIIKIVSFSYYNERPRQSSNPLFIRN